VELKVALDTGLLKSLLVFGAVIEARDAYTGGHVWRVARIAELIALEAGLTKGDVFRAFIGGFIHDIGKVGISDAILNKPGKLTEEEFEIMRTHPQIGRRILAAHPLAPLVIDAISHHHERTDGSGYPEGLERKEVSTPARIVTVADAFDAMTSKRPYRDGMEKSKAIEILEENSHAQFDLGLVGHLIKLSEANRLDGIIGHSDEQRPLLDCGMCGPTVVVPGNKRENDTVCCNKCKTEFRLHKEDDFFGIKATGRKRPAAQPEIDTEQIEMMVRKAPDDISI
jgi:HD-GYP domain-containing protein (c-di-GMP phosphodiesterase class II)